MHAENVENSGALLRAALMTFHGLFGLKRMWEFAMLSAPTFPWSEL